MIIVTEVSHPHELRSSFIYHEFENSYTDEENFEE